MASANHQAYSELFELERTMKRQRWVLVDLWKAIAETEESVASDECTCGAQWEPRPERGEDEGNMGIRIHKPGCPVYIAIENGTYYTPKEKG